MCAPKSKGGKRCLRHRANTKAVLTYVHAKTGVDKEQIYAIMKELNKEGRGLEAPSKEELEQYFNLEEFKAKYDNTLDEKEKVAILKNLLQARAEADEHGVTGGSMHAWKNALARTVDRVKKPLIAAGLAGALIFSVSACSPNVDPVTPPNGTGTSTSAPVDGSDNGMIPCSTDNPGPYGDAVAKEQITDDKGTYCHVTIDPESNALKYDASKTDTASLEQYGFTQEDAEAAQKSAVTFVVEQSMDSTLLDNYTATSGTEWLDANKKELLNPSQYKLYEDYAKETNLEKGVVVTGDGFPALRRDGSPRSEAISVQVEKILAKEMPNGTPYIQVATNVSGSYPAKNQDIINFAVKGDKGITEEGLKASSPYLFANPDGQSSMIVTGIFSVAYEKGNYNQFAGTTTDWTLATVEG
jgi:hypothetical protein